MSAAAESNVVSPAEAIFDLVEQLVHANVRLAQLEAMATDGADIIARLDAFDARLTALEKRQRRPPPFPVTLISNETRKIQPDTDPAHPMVEKIWQRLINEASEQIVDQRLKAVSSTLHQQAAEFARNRETFERMRTAFKAMSARIEAVEAQTATPTKWRHDHDP
jgi:hypothetical protein